MSGPKRKSERNVSHAILVELTCQPFVSLEIISNVFFNEAANEEENIVEKTQDGKRIAWTSSKERFSFDDIVSAYR